MKNWIINNFWIKIFSLILAVFTWFYVNGELKKERYRSGEYYKSSFITHLGNESQRAHPEKETKKGNRGYIMEKK